MREGLDSKTPRPQRRWTRAVVVVDTLPVIEAAKGTLELYAVLDAAEAVASARPPGPTAGWASPSIGRTSRRTASDAARERDALLPCDGICIPCFAQLS